MVCVCWALVTWDVETSKTQMIMNTTYRCKYLMLRMFHAPFMRTDLYKPRRDCYIKRMQYHYRAFLVIRTPDFSVLASLSQFWDYSVPRNSQTSKAVRLRKFESYGQSACAGFDRKLRLRGVFCSMCLNWIWFSVARR
jgi:hypothetical protein